MCIICSNELLCSNELFFNTAHTTLVLENSFRKEICILDAGHANGTLMLRISCREYPILSWSLPSYYRVTP